jgi:hypothetical protein
MPLHLALKPESFGAADLGDRERARVRVRSQHVTIARQGSPGGQLLNTDHPSFLDHRSHGGGPTAGSAILVHIDVIHG